MYSRATLWRKNTLSVIRTPAALWAEYGDEVDSAEPNAHQAVWLVRRAVFPV